MDRLTGIFADGIGAAAATSGILTQLQGRIFGLLYLQQEPLSLDEITDELQQSKSNVSVQIRGLVDWQLVRQVRVAGSRKDHYAAATDFWRVMQEILERRFRWNLRQVLATVEEAERGVAAGHAAKTTGGRRADEFARGRLNAMRDYFLAVDAGLGAFSRGEPMAPEAMRDSVVSRIPIEDPGYGLKMNPVAGTDLHAVACAVPTDARDLVLPDRFEYADAFAVTLPPGTTIAAQEWARAMFMPRGLAQQALAGAWNAVIALEPRPMGAHWAPSSWCRLSANRRSWSGMGEGTGSVWWSWQARAASHWPPLFRVAAEPGANSCEGFSSATVESRHYCLSGPWQRRPGNIGSLRRNQPKRPTHRAMNRTGVRLLPFAATVFMVGNLLHTADHFRRGWELPLFGVTPQVMTGGLLVTIGAAVTLALALTNHRLAPQVAVAVGFYRRHRRIGGAPRTSVGGAQQLLPGAAPRRLRVVCRPDRNRRRPHDRAGVGCRRWEGPRGPRAQRGNGDGSAGTAAVLVVVEEPIVILLARWTAVWGCLRRGAGRRAWRAACPSH